MDVVPDGRRPRVQTLVLVAEKPRYQRGPGFDLIVHAVLDHGQSEEDVSRLGWWIWHAYLGKTLGKEAWLVMNRALCSGSQIPAQRHHVPCHPVVEPLHSE